MAHRARGHTGPYLWLARVGGAANLRVRRRIRPLARLAVAISSPAWAHNIPTEQQRALASGGYLDYAWSGAVHMLTGYDHLLFLFGVMFFLTKFRDIVTFVTAFTIGHSVTLLGATLLGIRANHYLIDAVIAVSVIYKGFDNLDGFRRAIGIKAPNALAMVLGFGLIHGFGLATRLQQLQLPEQGLVTRILAFNVGVELGQLAALVVMAWGLGLVREDSKDFGPFTRAANGALVSAGVLLLLFQLHGYFHTAYPDEYGFSRDQHMHHHEDAERFNREIGDALRPPR